MQCYLCTYLETHSVPNCDIISERVSYGHRTRQHQDAYAERNYPTAGLKTLVSSCTDYFRTVWYCAKGWCRRGIWSPTGSYHKVCCQKIAAVKITLLQTEGGRFSKYLRMKTNVINASPVCGSSPVEKYVLEITVHWLRTGNEVFFQNIVWNI